MVKINFVPVSTQKTDKEADTVVIAEAHDPVVCPLASKTSFPLGLLFLGLAVVVFLSGLVMASVFTYRHYSAPQIPEDSLFHCRILYEDAFYAPLGGRHELDQRVGIHLEDNYEQISVPVPHFGGSDPADIIHDFQRGLTAYFDIALDKCYITELNSSSVMAPRSLWELLVNIKRGTYLPHTYIVQEEMVVTGRVRNLRALGPFIYRLCHNKETFRLRRRPQRQRIERRETRRCHRIRHFENTFAVETLICESF